VKKLLLTIFLISSIVTCQSPEPRDYLKTETEQEKNERMMWWRDAGFGMFIHWGLYAIPAGEYGDDRNHAEWIQETANITVEEYEKYAAQFNPTKYDAKKWVKIAKDAGMKYIVITSKHHDGFCLWDSKITDYDIMDSSPYKRDILKELEEACIEEEITLCFYHSIMDWHHPDAQGINHPDYNHGKGPNPNFSNYAEKFMKPQLKELLTNYGEIGVLWFDGEWITEWTEEQGKVLYNQLRNIQPNIIINNRVGKGRQGMEGMNAYEDAAGDFGTPEQEILEGSSTLDWESCMTMNNHWGFNKFDDNFKSAESLIHNLVDITAKGGNYLLNVGPTAEGEIPAKSIQRLKEMGEWMEVNGEVIYSSRGAKNYLENESIYYIRSKDDKYLYAVLTEWPGESVQLKYADPVAGSEMQLLGSDEPLVWEDQKADGINIKLPSAWQNAKNRPVKYAWVIKMKGAQTEIVEQPQFIMNATIANERELFSKEAVVTLKSTTDGSKIFYTTGKEVVSSKSVEYTKPIKLNKTTTIRTIAVKEGSVSSQISEATFLKASRYKSVKYKEPYSDKYGGMGNLTLGDGIFGGDEHTNGKWLGFEGVDIVATVDLGEIKSVEAVSTSFLQSTKHWIFFPESMEVSISTDGENYKSVATIKNKIEQKEKKSQSHLLKATFSTQKVRYARIRAKNIKVCPEWHPGAGGKAWLFADEIIVE